MVVNHYQVVSRLAGNRKMVVKARAAIKGSEAMDNFQVAVNLLARDQVLQVADKVLMIRTGWGDHALVVKGLHLTVNKECHPMKDRDHHLTELRKCHLVDSLQTAHLHLLVVVLLVTVRRQVLPVRNDDTFPFFFVKLPNFLGAN